MTRKLILLIPILCISLFAKSQFNDTITYKSGMIKVVEIDDFETKLVKYTYVNHKGDTTNSFTNISVIKYFKIYDNDGILSYSSKISEDIADLKASNLKYPSEVSVSKHSLSLNPFFIPFLSLNLRHNYTFGEKMQFAVTSRLTYLSPIISGSSRFGDLLIGSGVKFIPFYNQRFSFGVDITPMVGLFPDEASDIYFLLPVNLNFDFYFNKSFGIAIDFGFGNAYRTGISDLYARGHFGILWQLKTKKTFETNYR